MAPEIPTAMYNSGATTLPVWPTCNAWARSTVHATNPDNRPGSDFVFDYNYISRDACQTDFVRFFDLRELQLFRFGSNAASRRSYSFRAFMIYVSVPPLTICTDRFGSIPVGCDHMVLISEQCINIISLSGRTQFFPAVRFGSVPKNQAEPCKGTMNSPGKYSMMLRYR